MTETGYLMLVKSFRDDLSWNVQRQLVTTYFNVKQVAEASIDHTETSDIISYYKEENKRLSAELGHYKDALFDEIRKQKSVPAFASSTPWKRVEFQKLNVIRGYMENTDPSITLSKVMGIVNKKLEDTYNVCVNNYTRYFVNTFGADERWYLLDMIEYEPELRTMYEITTDELLESFKPAMAQGVY